MTDGFGYLYWRSAFWIFSNGLIRKFYLYHAMFLRVAKIMKQDETYNDAYKKQDFTKKSMLQIRSIAQEVIS